MEDFTKDDDKKRMERKHDIEQQERMYYLYNGSDLVSLDPDPRTIYKQFEEDAPDKRPEIRDSMQEDAKVLAKKIAVDVKNQTPFHGEFRKETRAVIDDDFNDKLGDVKRTVERFEEKEQDQDQERALQVKEVLEPVDELKVSQNEITGEVEKVQDQERAWQEKTVQTPFQLMLRTSEFDHLIDELKDATRDYDNAKDAYVEEHGETAFKAMLHGELWKEQIKEWTTPTQTPFMMMIERQQHEPSEQQQQRQQEIQQQQQKEREQGDISM